MPKPPPSSISHNWKAKRRSLKVKECRDLNQSHPPTLCNILHLLHHFREEPLPTPPLWKSLQSLQGTSRYIPKNKIQTLKKSGQSPNMHLSFPTEHRELSELKCQTSRQVLSKLKQCNNCYSLNIIFFITRQSQTQPKTFPQKQYYRNSVCSNLKNHARKPPVWIGA
jgi:hypothetical protein